MTREFKYYPHDFGELPVSVTHMDLDFDIYDDHTIVDSDLHITAKEELTQISLNAKELDIKEVKIDGQLAEYNYRTDDNMLDIIFSEKIPEGKEIVIHTKSICHPTENMLEGMYKDTTPKGCPCQFITQCQQWGFQRIVPCFDDMTAKCTYKTKITADVRYTHILSNGDVSTPRKDEGERSVIHYDNTKTPMATYLFFLGAGTYDCFTKELEYANGKKFMLELLVPPGSDKVAAGRALDILYDGVQWINIYTGPSAAQDLAKKNHIWELIKKRDSVNDSEKEGIRKELAELTGYISGYEYTGEVYREIGMQKSNFGGMENVGNTTVITNRIMPFADITDKAFEYMFRVKTHEFYHNLNGSEVTGKTPFEIWLNEAATVHVERQWYEFLFGYDYARLDEVQSIIAPQNGVMEQDLSPKSMPIEPDGFNDPDELITHITYQKAPEVVRMVERLLGKDKFSKALHNYHSTFKHSNASRSDWFGAMSNISGLDLKRFAQMWLKQTGFPTVHVRTMYLPETNQVEINLIQEYPEGKEHWEFPFVFALMNVDGSIAKEGLEFVQEKEVTITIDNVDEPAYFSFNRDFGAYIKVEYAQENDEQLFLQARTDSDIVNRFIAVRKLLDKEKLAVLEKKHESFSEKFMKLFKELLSDEKLIDSVGGSLLGISRSIDNDMYRFKFQELHDMAKTLRKSVASELKDELMAIYTSRKDKTFEGDYVERSVNELKNRQVKNFCLGLLCELDTEETRALAKQQFDESTQITDKWVGASLYLSSSANDRKEFLASLEIWAKENLVRWETFIGIVGGLDSDDALTFVKEVMNSDSFDINAPNDQHIFMYFGYNKRLSLLTDEGLDFIKDAIITCAPINEFQANHILEIFAAVDRYDEDVQVNCVKLLLEVVEKLDSKKQPSVVNTTKRLLKGSTKAIKTYEEKTGRKVEL